MMALRLVPVALGSVVLGAHFLRTGNVVVAVLIALAPLVLLARRTWAARAVQGLLLLGAAEWVRTLVTIAGERQARGAPYLRMAVILGAVAIVTALGALLLQPLATRWRRPVPAPVPGAEAA